MIYCDSPTLEEWIAPPQENLPRPKWTKLRAAGALLSSSIELVDWTADPVETMVCEACWAPGCSQAGLARIVRLGEHLLWLPPGPRDLDADRRDSPDDANFIREAVLMPVTAWNRLRERLPQLPTPEHYRRAARRDMAALWLAEMPEAVRVTRLDELANPLRAALASDPLDLDQAREIVQSMAGWILQNPAQPVEGQIVRAPECGCAINTFYFDGPPFEEWPAFVVERDNDFAFGDRWVYLSK